MTYHDNMNIKKYIYILMQILIFQVISGSCQQSVTFQVNLTNGLPYFIVIFVFSVNIATPLVKWIYLRILMVIT